MSNINEMLPDELLLMIFKWIPGYHACITLSQVCIRWAHLSRSYALHIRTIKDLKRLHRCPNSLLITVGLPRPGPLINNLKSLAPYLRELSIHSEMSLHDDEFEILSALPNLRHLDVFLFLQELGSHLLPVVQRLCSFVINDSVNEGFLRGLAAAPRLYALNMFGFSLYYPKSDMVIFLKASVNRLSELTIRCNELTDDVYELISTCVNLKTLQLYSCWSMTKLGALAIMRLPQLRCLHITGTCMMGQDALSEVISEMPQTIHELVLSRTAFSDSHINDLSMRLPGLFLLEICQTHTSRHGLVNLVSLLPNLKQFDTDIFFEASLRKTLSMHPTLKVVTCPIQDDIDIEDGNVKFIPGDGRGLFPAIRGEGEGYRADIFHYWSQRLPIEMVPNYGKELHVDSMLHSLTCGDRIIWHHKVEFSTT